MTDFHINLHENKTLIDNLKNFIQNQKSKLDHINNVVNLDYNHPQLKEKFFLEKQINKFDVIFKSYEFILEILTIEDLDPKEIDALIKTNYEDLYNFFLETKFTLEDFNPCFMEIQTGTGGDDAEDLTSILFNMYKKWSEKFNYKFEPISLVYTDQGLRNALIKIEGTHAYGLLKTESGIHRFVRNSPFNNLNKRQTSFIGVHIYPFKEDSILVIDDKDLEFSYFRASGAGGQHVNKTDSGVRIKHKPTGTIVECQNERSQHQNKQIGLKFLKIKLEKNKLLEKNQESLNVYLNKQDISWGQQIRSYILNPYKLIKDLRSNYQTQNVNEFLNGNLLHECLYFNITKLL